MADEGYPCFVGEWPLEASELSRGELEKKLNEAKEIIRDLLLWEDRSDYGEHLCQSDPELLAKAEAFLKEE